MAQRKLLTNGSAFKRTDGRWCGVVWYMDEYEQRKRKSFCGTTKAEVNKKMTETERILPIPCGAGGIGEESYGLRAYDEKS